jgi:hypothetical protein
MSFGGKTKRASGRCGVVLLVAVAALVSLTHGIEHDFIAGDDHHEEGDAADQGVIEFILLALAGTLLAVGGVFRRPSQRDAIRVFEPSSALKSSPVFAPESRAGPSVLCVFRS